MPTWFSKVFKEEKDKAPAPVSPVSSVPPPAWDAYEDDDDDEDDYPKPRRVVHAPVLVDEEPAAATGGEGVRIKARVDDKAGTVVFMIDRPVLKGFSFVCPDRATAHASSPLAAALFDAGGVASVVLHDTTVTVTRDGTGNANAEDFAKEIGAQIRAHLLSGMPAVDPAFVDSIPSEDDIRGKLQNVIDEEINPGISSHSGVITLNRVVGNTAYITMGGGCQGCAASSITLRSGIEKSFRDVVPGLGALLDETDHASGVNPYFSELPVGMGR